MSATSWSQLHQQYVASNPAIGPVEVYETAQQINSNITTSQQALGNLGATATLVLTTALTVASCTLTSNCVLTISGFQAGYSGVLLGNTGAGGFTLSINDGQSTGSIIIPTTASTSFIIQFWSEDGISLWATI